MVNAERRVRFAGSYMMILVRRRLKKGVYFTTMTTTEEIQKLEKRKEMAVYQRKITTQLLTVIEYDHEIDAIDRRLEQLQYKLKAEQRSSLNAL